VSVEYCLEIRKKKKSENQVLQSGWRLGADRPHLGTIAQKEAVSTNFLRLGAAPGREFTTVSLFLTRDWMVIDVASFAVVWFRKSERICGSFTRKGCMVSNVLDSSLDLSSHTPDLGFRYLAY
jgi:hypothetical protein